MSIPIKKIRHLWYFENEHYKTTEIGSGVQKFVKEVFKCKDIFNLSEGKLSTAIFRRKNEFIEEAKKKGHRADVVIFIDSDIIIPVEVEKYTHINLGETQIRQYQTDWQKKLGLLTDGYEWRFYNNLYIEKRFTIEDILSKTHEFLTFWQEYTRPESYYLSFFEKKGQLKLFEFPPTNVDNVRQDFFIDITRLIETFKNKLNLKGYFNNEKLEIDKQKKAVEITYAYLIQFILYKTLVDNTFIDFENDYNERIKSIAKALKAEIYGDILQKIKGISDTISDNIYKRFNDEQLIINERLDEILKKPKQDIGDVSVWLDILLFITRYNFTNVQNEIFGYVYENYLKDLYLDEKKGQYFTDPLVVEFMLDELGYTKENLKKKSKKNKDSLSIIDPSCGSGTFLYNATTRIVDTFSENNKKTSKLAEKLINENIFGLDIAEFPLFLAEMNILMHMLPLIITEKYNNPIDQKIKIFKTNDSISEFLDTEIRNTLADINQELKSKGAVQMQLFSAALDIGYESFMRDKRDLNELKRSLENRNNLPRYRFDFVIGNPPYVGYNECSRQKLLFIKLMQSGKIQMNNIYGFNLNTVPGRIKAYAPKPNLYAFFIALGFGLLKDGGKITYIIPQNILSAADLDVIRFHLSNYYTIHRIINFSCKMFIGRGILQNKPIPTSSLIFTISKISPIKTHKVEIINYNNIDSSIEEALNNIRKSKQVTKVKLLQNKLCNRIANWNFIKYSKKENELIDYYLSKGESMDIYRDYTLSRQRFNDIFIIDGSYNIPNKEIDIEQTSEEEYYDIPILDKKYYSIHKYAYYPKSKKIKIAKGGQGLKVVDTEYKVIWNYINYDKFYFVGPNSNLLPKFQQFCIGSNNKTETLYLLSILNSPINRFILFKFLKNDNEKDILVGVKAIKEFIRVPIIYPDNKNIKSEIIYQTDILLNIETKILSDIVNFSNVLLQKFDNLRINVTGK
jgi:hypothetical protein